MPDAPIVRKKILLSAFCCEPNRGSEAAVGWHWAIETARMGYEVWVLTHTSRKPQIETALEKTAPPEHLHFLFYSLPPWMRYLGQYAYYLCWQWGAFQFAARVHKRERFDLAHHVSFASVRQPSFMGNLGIPFVFGPVGGGERAPWNLRLGYGLRGWIMDGLRDLSNSLVRFDPLMCRTFSQAERIYVTTRQSYSLLPHRHRRKASILLAIGCEEEPHTRRIRKSCHDSETRILFVGRWLHWKGMHLGLAAFAALQRIYPRATLTIIGEGPEERRWKSLANNLCIHERVLWIPWVERTSLSKEYESHHLMLFPSLHDSGGSVVLEALAHGLPVICLKLGGPGEIVDGTCGRSIVVDRKTQKEVVQELAESLADVAMQPNLRRELSQGARAKAARFKWPNLARLVHTS